MLIQPYMFVFSTSTTRWEWRLVSFNKKRVVDHLSFWIRINRLSNNPPLPLMISHVYFDHNPFSVRKLRNLQNHKFCSQPLYHEAYMWCPISFRDSLFRNLKMNFAQSSSNTCKHYFTKIPSQYIVTFWAVFGTSHFGLFLKWTCTSSVLRPKNTYSERYFF